MSSEAAALLILLLPFPVSEWFLSQFPIFPVQDLEQSLPFLGIPDSALPHLMFLVFAYPVFASQFPFLLLFLCLPQLLFLPVFLLYKRRFTLFS